jgi:hypothetical protein
MHTDGFYYFWGGDGCQPTIQTICEMHSNREFMQIFFIRQLSTNQIPDFRLLIQLIVASDHSAPKGDLCSVLILIKLPLGGCTASFLLNRLFWS